jgi:hypothetical protein
MQDNGKADKDATLPAAKETELDDERLNSAAAPFLYLLGGILIAVAGYFAYTFLRG